MLPDRVGSYIIEKELGSGGMGNVYLGHHIETHEPAAIKVLPASLAREEGFVARFEREANALSMLDHPNIVQLYEHGAEGDSYYLAMEYAEGETVLAMLKRVRRIPWRDVIHYALQICAALKHAHDSGVVHRDLKPSNLMITQEGTVKLLDFGVAQVFAGTRLTATGGIIGTVEYMSPEQAQGRRVTKKSDLYSLGAVMYAMLAGKPPFSGSTMLDVVQKHKFGQFDRPRHFAPQMPYWLDELVCELLEKDPDKRPPDARVLARRLNEILKKVEISDREETSAENKSTPAMRDVPTDAPTRTAPGTTQPDMQNPREPGEATLFSSLMRADIEAQQMKGPVAKFFDNTLVLIVLFVLIVGGGIYLYQTQRMTPEKQLAKARNILGEPPSNRWILARNEYLLPLLDNDPNRWSPEVEPLLQQISHWELSRTYPSFTQRAKPSPQPISEPIEGLDVDEPITAEFEEDLPDPEATHTSNNSEPAQSPFEQVRLAINSGDTERAVRLLNAIINLTDNQAEYSDINARARRELQALMLPEAMPNLPPLVASSLARIRQLAQLGEVEDARRLYDDLAVLYHDDPAIRPKLDEAMQWIDPQATDLDSSAEKTPPE
ncbi:serine/threonine protein kinase [Calycomorphotria hydatis]|uniref:non-specific serine/threonine protein kinase n=1 Tax=Calycomorphotria hydatis TaxID=2528027 RepID=A0A517TD47_9PLAN|nr:serine/threonine-protein kinase [Calycomorphotria hydatis]QDT66300.1 Serine/threonine-protein kinase PrkC [Calycomorphotria hydatis]